jgi:SAM-dependent methyltransferase
MHHTLPPLAVLLPLAASCGHSRQPDVIYLPSAEAVVERMLSLARVGEGDLVYDLGCGDGRIVIAAARSQGARGVCNDIDPARIAEGRRNAAAAGVLHRIEFHQGDLFELDLHEATVVALYLSPALNLRLRPKLQRELRPGSRVVSHNFGMAEWRADSTVSVSWPSGGTSAVHLWIVPADVAGTWELALTLKGEDRRYRLRLDQEFQQVSGTASRGGRPLPLSDAKLLGDSISLALGDTAGAGAAGLALSGRIIQGVMEGWFAAGARTGRWRAYRPY